MSIPRKLPAKVKLVVTIPAYNEESTIESVIKSIPSSVEGIHEIRVLVVDDGSTDRTAKLAEKAGAKVVSNLINRGLAYTFSRALDEALDVDADIIVNTDADNQYDQSQIPSLVKPILERRADIVLGSRFAGQIEHMSFTKRWGNKIASAVLANVSHYPITDGQTGFRALTRDAAMKLNILSKFTYTQEMIIDSADKGFRLIEVPATFRKRADKNRLFNGVLDYFMRAASTIVVGNLKLRPISSFGTSGLIIILFGIYLGLPVIDNYFRTGTIGPAFLMRAIITGVLFIVGIEIAALGLIAALVKQNRQLVEKQLYEFRKARYSKKK
jgi:glycosyltransferase involved in cell wall biosynthesis